MLSICPAYVMALPDPDPIPADSGEAFVKLIDELLKLNGRVLEARKMSVEVAGLTPAHWLILVSIARAQDPPTVARIARSLGQARQGVQRIADHLATHDLVRFIDNPADRRARRLVVTPAGREAFALADAQGQAWAARIAAGLSTEALAQTSRMLALVRRRLEADARIQQPRRVK